jgi:hypothetical protein
MRTDFCSLIDFFIALAAGVHEKAEMFCLTVLPTISVSTSWLAD